MNPSGNGFYDIYTKGGPAILDEGILVSADPTFIDFQGAVTVTPSGSGVIVTIGAGAGATLATVSAASTTAPASIYTMTSGINVVFRAVDSTQYVQFRKDGIGSTTANGDMLYLTNETAAANNAQQYSPAIHWHGEGWNVPSGASQDVDLRMFLIPIQTNIHPDVGFQIAGSRNGGAYNNIVSTNRNIITWGSTDWRGVQMNLVDDTAAATDSRGYFINSGSGTTGLSLRWDLSTNQTILSGTDARWMQSVLNSNGNRRFHYSTSSISATIDGTTGFWGIGGTPDATSRLYVAGLGAGGINAIFGLDAVNTSIRVGTSTSAGFEIGTASGYAGINGLGASQNIFLQGGATNGNVYIGTSSSLTAKFGVLWTTEQMRIAYDTSNYWSSTVGSTGAVTWNAVGSGASFNFSDKVFIADATANTSVLTVNNNFSTTGLVQVASFEAPASTGGANSGAYFTLGWGGSARWQITHGGGGGAGSLSYTYTNSGTISDFNQYIFNMEYLGNFTFRGNNGSPYNIFTISGGLEANGGGIISHTPIASARSSGTRNYHSIATGVSTTGTAVTNYFNISGTLNTSSSGITRGIFLNHTYTAVADFRAIEITPAANITLTSGAVTFLQSTSTFAPTSGTATLTGISLNPTINQTGGANGITRSIYINPTLTAAADYRAIEVTAGVSLFRDLKLTTAGDGLYVKEGSNATMGTATLSAGTVTVNTTKVTANSRIFLTVNGGTLTNVGTVYISARSAGTSFTISSVNVLDASDVAWIIIEPA